MTLQQMMEAAVARHAAGQLAQAEGLYRQILAAQPNQPEALHLLGVLAQQVGRSELAMELIREAIRFKPAYPEAYCNLGNILREVGRIDDAIGAYRQAVALAPNLAEALSNLSLALCDKGEWGEAIAACRRAIGVQARYADAHCNLGNALRGSGELEGAIAAYRQAIVCKADDAVALNNLGHALTEKGNVGEAIAVLRRAIAIKPDFAEAQFNLGWAFGVSGQLDEAVNAYRGAIACKANYAEAYNNLGNGLRDKGQLDDAIAAYRQAVLLKPTYAEAHNNLGNALKEKGQVDEELACYRRAIALNPKLHIAYCNLGSVLKEKGLLDEALEAYRAAIRINPGYSDAHSNLVFTMHYHPGYDEGAIAEELGRWHRQHAEPLGKTIQPHANDRSPDRRLRIGYVSPDLKEHPVGRFMLPLLSHHDKGQVEVFAYARVSTSDAMTQRLRGCTDGWRDLTGLSAAQAADAIRGDGIDILVDLALHTARDQLAIFARKPAPVQVAYLGYVGTTGLTTMDYRLTDVYLDPPEQLTVYYSERSIHLPGTYWCYPGFPTAPGVGALPAEKAGHITFGCFSNFCKINDMTLSVWCELLKRVPDSRLRIHAYDGDHRQRVWRFFEQRGIDSSRVAFTGRLPLAQYFAQYEPIDIALDTFPYGGGTTTCDALWMGVPVVSLIGKTAVGRGGWSILSNIGLAELAGRSEEEYVRIAVELAGDIGRLKELRSTMRQRMGRSRLMDAPRFARDMEAVYRQMWKNWCAGKA